MNDLSNSEFFHEIVNRYSKLKYALLEAQTFNPTHYGFPPLYYKILEHDLRRINAFNRAFIKYNNFRNKVVCEAGVGTLALAKYYLPYVKKAYLIESNPEIIPFIKQELKKNGWTKKVELIHRDAMSVVLPEKVDFIVGEMMSIFCANELQVPVFKHLSKFLYAGGKLIPEKIINLAQLCHATFEANYQHYPIFFTHHLPEQLSTKEIINTIDLYNIPGMHVKCSTPFTPTLGGPVNAVYLHSWVQLCEGINFTGTDSLMPPTVVKLPKEIRVKPNQQLILDTKFTYGTSLAAASFELNHASQ
jgi:predicted RNA methylase